MHRSREQILEIIYRQLTQLAIDERITLAPELAAETTLESLRLDSLDLLRLAMGLEDDLQMEIQLADLPKERTIAQIADLLLRLKD